MTEKQDNSEYLEAQYRFQIRKHWRRWLDMLAEQLEKEEVDNPRQAARELLKVICDDAIKTSLNHGIKHRIVPVIDEVLERLFI